jgi:hypothetical protein
MRFAAKHGSEQRQELRGSYLQAAILGEARRKQLAAGRSDVEGRIADLAQQGPQDFLGLRACLPGTQLRPRGASFREACEGRDRIAHARLARDALGVADFFPYPDAQGIDLRIQQAPHGRGAQLLEGGFDRAIGPESQSAKEHCGAKHERNAAGGEDRAVLAVGRTGGIERV